ncbi:MAG: amidohydrolase [Clostridiales bacterium]|nr:amidohydrolase [Clostridiales bacterium]
MVIDFHTHAFPDTLAERAISKLSSTGGGLKSYGSGTITSLLDSMDISGIDRAVILNIATNPRQQTNVNNFAIETNRAQLSGDKPRRLYALGSLNPDSDCIAAEARRIADVGIRGVKIHPDFMNAAIDDPRFDAVYRACIDNDLFLVSHAGWDFSSPDLIHCTPDGILRVLDRFPSLRFVAAHMGSARMWDDVERLLIGKNLWIETSIAVMFGLDKQQCARMLKNHDPDKLLFGSDFPWYDERESFEYVDSLEISDELKLKIFSENALKLLEG